MTRSGIIQSVYFAALLLSRWAVGDAYTPQPNVLSDGKKNALFIWIQLKDGTDVGQVTRKMANLQAYVEQVCAGSSCERVTGKEGYDDQVLAGVGFGYQLYSQATGNASQRNYTLVGRKGFLGDLPSTGGDVFVHAKSNSHSKLFELSQTVMKNLPPESIAAYKDIYGFQYKGNRDLSGFIDGTENAVRATRPAIALDPETNGSYCLTQEWIHDMSFIASQPAPTLEEFVGRKLADSEELRNKSVSAHVARMTSGPEPGAKKPVEIYRQSMPYGSLGKGAGLFFIAFAANTNNFDFMLNRMAGKTGDSSDDIMRLSRCASGNYWYFPSMEELERLRNSVAGAAFRAQSRATKQLSPSDAAMCDVASSSSLAPASNWWRGGGSLLYMCVGLTAIFGRRL